MRTFFNDHLLRFFDLTPEFLVADYTEKVPIFTSMDIGKVSKLLEETLSKNLLHGEYFGKSLIEEVFPVLEVWQVSKKTSTTTTQFVYDSSAPGCWRIADVYRGVVPPVKVGNMEPIRLSFSTLMVIEFPEEGNLVLLQE